MSEKFEVNGVSLYLEVAYLTFRLREIRRHSSYSLSDSYPIFEQTQVVDEDGDEDEDENPHTVTISGNLEPIFEQEVYLVANDLVQRVSPVARAWISEAAESVVSLKHWWDEADNRYIYNVQLGVASRYFTDIWQEIAERPKAEVLISCEVRIYMPPRAFSLDIAEDAQQLYFFRSSDNRFTATGRITKFEISDPWK